MTRAACYQSSAPAVSPASSGAATALERTGIDGFSWLDRGLGGRAQGAFEELLRARALGDDASAARALATTVGWLAELDSAERLEVCLQLVARWRWLWSVDGDDDPEGELTLTTLAVWVGDDVAELLETTLDGLESASLPQERLALLLRSSASSLFDLSHVLPRWRVVAAAAPTLAGGAVTSELLSALETLRAAESRPSSKARRPESNQEERLATLIARARERF